MEWAKEAALPHMPQDSFCPLALWLFKCVAVTLFPFALCLASKVGMSVLSEQHAQDSPAAMQSMCYPPVSLASPVPSLASHCSVSLLLLSPPPPLPFKNAKLVGAAVAALAAQLHSPLHVVALPVLAKLQSEETGRGKTILSLSYLNCHPH